MITAINLSAVQVQPPGRRGVELLSQSNEKGSKEQEEAPRWFCSLGNARIQSSGPGYKHSDLQRAEAGRLKLYPVSPLISGPCLRKWFLRGPCAFPALQQATLAVVPNPNRLGGPVPSSLG